MVNRKPEGMTRRRWAAQGGLALLGAGAAGAELGWTGRIGSRRRRAESGILLVLVGGPSQIDTWDPKPEAASEVRSPFATVRTNVPGVEITEIFPRMAKMADRYAIVRSFHHLETPAVHDRGHQLIQTGRVAAAGFEPPSMGCVLGAMMPPANGMPGHVVLPGPIGNTGGDRRHGEGSGCLGAGCDPWMPGVQGNPELTPTLHAAASLELEPEEIRSRYGWNRFGQDCLRARRLIEAGVRFVTVNMFDTVFDQLTWDAHGTQPFTPLRAYRDVVGPMFDEAYTALLGDLYKHGLLEQTLVVAAGEFGRTPRFNRWGGRDHWPNCSSLLMAGGGVRGGQVVGRSDGTGAEPVERPVSPADLAASVYYAFGMDAASAQLADGRGLVEWGARAIGEIFY
jgi:hypothetical protein